MTTADRPSEKRTRDPLVERGFHSVLFRESCHLLLQNVACDCRVPRIGAPLVHVRKRRRPTTSQKVGNHVPTVVQGKRSFVPRCDDTGELRSCDWLFYIARAPINVTCNVQSCHLRESYSCDARHIAICNKSSSRVRNFQI